MKKSPLILPSSTLQHGIKIDLLVGLIHRWWQPLFVLRTAVQQQHEPRRHDDDGPLCLPV